MHTRWFAIAALLALWMGSGSVAAGAVVLQSRSLRLEIGDDGTLRSLTSLPEGVEYAAGGAPFPIAVIYRGGQAVPDSEGEYAASTGRWIYRGGARFPATRVAQEKDELAVEFGAASVTARYRVRRTDEYLAFELVAVEGEAIDRIDFLRLRVRKLPYLGQWVNAAYDEEFGVCLCGGNLQTHAEMLALEREVMMAATAEAAVGFRGPAAVLFGCHRPQARFLDAMGSVERDFQLPRGAESRRSPLQKLSYLWATRPTPDNIDQYIRFAQRGGFRVLLISYTAFAKGPGHFVWNERYPNGMADLRRVTDAIRRAGLRTGLHIHYSKAGKADPYVTPVPDGRLHAVRTFTLASDLGANDTVIPVAENPGGCTLDDGRRVLQVGKELIQYRAYSTQTPYQFRGGERGHLGTAAAAHARGETVRLLDVDTWPAFIRFDQNTDIQDEVARRIADIYRQTGPYDMVYFDGAEDVHEPFWYHVASAQYRVFRLLDPPPPVCESAHYTHFSWHMISRSNAYDVVAPADGMKDFCRLMPCPTAAARAHDFSRIQFGWLGRFGGRKGACAGPDVYEYVASRAAAWDCPIALHASLEELQSNPRAEDCLAAIKVWEDARVGDQLSDRDRDVLKNVAPEDARYVSCYQQREMFQRARENRGLEDWQRRILADRREHHLFVNEQGRYELVEIQEVPGVAGNAVKVYLFRRAASPADTYVLAWAVDAPARLQLPLNREGLCVMRPFGTPQPFISLGESCEALIGPRTYLVFRHADAQAARQILRRARAVPPPSGAKAIRQSPS